MQTSGDSVARSRTHIQFVARMSEATSGDHSNTAPDIASLIRATKLQNKNGGE